MDCKRLIAIGLAVVACSESSTIPSRFDGPVSGDVLDAEEGPFSRPVGLVANTRSGQVLPIDLSRGWLLSDSTGSPFLAADPIAVGANRVLGELMVHSPDQQSVSVFAVDKGSEELLEFPWIEGVEDGRLLRAAPEASEVVFEDAEPSGDAVTVANLQLLSGHTTTEDWVLTYDGTSWTVEGSASGIQELRAHFGVPYRSDEKALRFTLVGQASVGDSVRFSTSTGLVRHQLGGAIQEAVKLDGTGGLALLSLKDSFDQTGRLVFFDLSEGAPVGELPLPPGSMPYRVAADGEASWAYVVDLALDGVHAVELNNPFPLTSSVSWIDVGFPVADIAVVKGDDYEHLFLARADRNEVVVWDLILGSQKDVNLATPEVDGIRLDAPVVGLAAARGVVELPETTGFGAAYRDITVAIATHGGELWLAEGATGCFVQNAVGPYAYTSASGYFFDEGAVSNPDFEDGSGLGEVVEVSGCGGVVYDEDWTLTFSESMGAWQVEGSFSGVQQSLAVEDQRYVSDSGAVSFLIRSGSSMSTQGDQLTFTTRAGLVVANGDTDGDGAIEITLENPGRPVPFAWREQAGDEGWSNAQASQGFLWPIGNSDVALIVDASDAQTQAVLD